MLRQLKIHSVEEPPIYTEHDLRFQRERPGWRGELRASLACDPARQLLLNTPMLDASLHAAEPLSMGLHGSIDRWFRLPAEPLEILGTTSPVLAASLLLHHYPELRAPHLVIVPTSEEQRRFTRALKFLDPGAEFLELPSFADR